MTDEMKPGEKQFILFVEKASRLMFSKSAKYMPPNAVLGGMPEELATFAETSRASGVSIPKLLLSRCFEKLYRASNMIEAAHDVDNHNETLEDTYLDLVNYLFMSWQYINWLKTRDRK